MSMNTNKERRWDSVDVYSSAETGKRYNIAAAGYRILFLSQVPNITKAEKVN